METDRHEKTGFYTTKHSVAPVRKMHHLFQWLNTAHSELRSTPTQYVSRFIVHMFETNFSNKKEGS